MPLSPQCKTVLEHLQSEGSITGAEAATVHRIRHLPRRIADLKDAGWSIHTDLKEDVTGQRYARYVLLGRAADEDTVMRILSRRAFESVDVAPEVAQAQHAGGNEWFLGKDSGYSEVFLDIEDDEDGLEIVAIRQDEDMIVLTRSMVRDLVATIRSIEGKMR